MLFLQSFLRKGVSLSYVGRKYDLKDLKNLLLQNQLAASVAGGAIWTAVQGYLAHKKLPLSCTLQ
jgi:hypothetical protein